MTPAALLLDLRCRGVDVRPDGSDLVLTPADIVTPSDIERVRAQKPQLLALLHDVASLKCDGTAASWRDLYERLPERDRARFAAEVADGYPIACLLALCLDEPMISNLPTFRGVA